MCSYHKWTIRRWREWQRKQLLLELCWGFFKMEKSEASDLVPTGSKYAGFTYAALASCGRRTKATMKLPPLAMSQIGSFESMGHSLLNVMPMMSKAIGMANSTNLKISMKTWNQWYKMLKPLAYFRSFLLHLLSLKMIRRTRLAILWISLTLLRASWYLSMNDIVDIQSKSFVNRK